MSATQRVAAATLLVACALACAAPAHADPTSTAATIEGALALPRTEGAPTHFGFAGKRPLDTTTASGIARPTPAPVVEARGFGFARHAPLRAEAEVATTTRAPTIDVGPCGDAPTLQIDGRCTTGNPCGPCLPPTRRVATDPLSIPTTFWSSGYHDGRNARCEPACDPCRTTCDPCVRRCDPCVTPCDPCPPRRVYYRRCAPRVYYAPCAPCGPRWSCAPCGPRWGCGPCGPRWGCGGCGPCGGYAPAAAAIGFGLGLAIPLLACACW